MQRLLLILFFATKIIFGETSTYQTPLIAACNSGEIKIVRFMLTPTIDINEADDRGWTPLMFAIKNGNIEIVKLLLQAGADINITTDEGWTPLLLAAYNHYNEIFSLLSDSGANINMQDCAEGWTFLMFAIEKGLIDAVEYFIVWGADINMHHKGATPLITALEYSHPEIAKRLIIAGADVNTPDHDDGCTPLMLAAAEGYTEVVHLLLFAGADIYAKDIDQNTALSLALEYDNSEIANLLSKMMTD